MIDYISIARTNLHDLRTRGSMSRTINYVARDIIGVLEKHGASVSVLYPEVPAEEARTVFDAELKQLHIKSARASFNTLKIRNIGGSTNARLVRNVRDGLYYSGSNAWVLDDTWDIEPLNGKSNAQMEYELAQAAKNSLKGYEAFMRDRSPV